ncbi:hypothetical protein JCM3774_004918 [Rhodotorula dairenensis]
MAPLSSAKLLWLLTVLRQTLALSAHSPRDLEAFPAYNVVLSDRAVLNETALELLAEVPTADEPAHAQRRHLLRTPSGQAFLCTVPVVEEERKAVDAQAEKDALVEAAERDKGLANGLALLEPMRNGCLYLRQGWFTYSFCYGTEIRQFHEIRVAGAIGPSEDPDSESYSLGLMPEPTSVVKAPKYGSGSAAVLKQERIPARLGGEASQGLGWDEGGRYLSQTWSSGTVCDKTGLPREVEVQFHCNTQSTDRIAWIRETSICRYVMLIHTPRLCGERIFLEGRTDNAAPAAAIECQPVVRQLPKEISGDETASPAPTEKVAKTEQDQADVPDQHDSMSSEADPVPSSAQDERIQSDNLHEHLEDGHEHLDDGSDQYFEDGYEEQETMLSLVYDPETGEIESAVTDSGEDVFLDSALRRMLFGDDDAEVVPGDDHGPLHNHVVQAADGVDASLADLRQLIHDSISDALRTYAAHGGAGVAAGEAAPAPDHQARPPHLPQPLDDVVQSLLAAVRSPQDQLELEQQQPPPPETENAPPQQEQQERQGRRRPAAAGRVAKMQPGLHKYLQQFERERKTVQVPQKAVLGSDEHERLKRGFARRYEEAHDASSTGEDGQQDDEEHVRDEL